MAFYSLVWTVLLIPTNVPYVFALTPSQYCFWGCNSVLYNVAFVGSPNFCTNELFYKSNYYCAAVHCSEREIQDGLDYANSSCDYVLPQFESIVRGVDLEAVQRISWDEAPSTFETPLNHTIVPDQGFFDVGYRTTATFYNNFNLSYDFSYSLYGFWGLAVTVGGLNRIIEASHRRDSRKHNSHQTAAASSSRVSQLWLWIRRSLILPATFNQRCQEPIGWCTLPPRFESLLLAVYILLNFIYCFPGYYTFLPNAYYSETKLQLCRYLSDRTGILAIANVPIIWLFATRNDPLLWLTGWSFATYNRFHRWVARVATLQAIAHSIGYSVYSYYVGGGDYAAEWKYRYWYTGQIATIIMSLSLVFAVYALRKNHYDFFLVLHIVLAIVFLVTLYYHVWIFDGKFNGFIWPCVVIWSLDRLIRFVRIAYCSLLPRLLKGVKATATYDRDSEMIRLDVTDFLSDAKIRPGIFYYLYAPGATRGYESHPYTLCSWRRNPGSSSTTISSAETKAYGTDDCTSSSPSIAESQELCHSFLIRPYGGFTARLRNQLAASLEGRSSSQITVLLEGPYGKSLDLSSYSNILVIAGGSGITAAISHTHHLLQHERVSVQIVWAVPQKHLVDDLCAHELASVLGHARVAMEVYLTNAAALEKDAIVPHAPYKVHFGRPNVLVAMECARSKCLRNMAIVSCGTPPMSDACRRAIVEVLKQDGPSVAYFDETMTW